MDVGRGEGSPFVASYLARIQDRRILTREEEAQLAHRVRTGCIDSRNSLVEANLGFVMQVARQYRDLGLPFEDLLNEGSVGLMTAAERFDPARGNKFITFAIWWIRKAILEALGRSSAIVHVPHYQRRRARQIREAEDSMRRSLGRAHDRLELSDGLGESVESIDRTLRAGLTELSLDHHGGHETETPSGIGSPIPGSGAPSSTPSIGTHAVGCRRPSRSSPIGRGSCSSTASVSGARRPSR